LCHEAKIKRDRDAKKMKDGSMLSFLKPKAIPVRIHPKKEPLMHLKVQQRCRGGCSQR